MTSHTLSHPTDLIHQRLLPIASAYLPLRFFPTSPSLIPPLSPRFLPFLPTLCPPSSPHLPPPPPPPPLT
ncbi:unnamed protein product [Closterium sp. NIES-64]|nr:unnamed protein product [Closterium sp. NIES-64]